MQPLVHCPSPERDGGENRTSKSKKTSGSRQRQFNKLCKGVKENK